VLARALRGCGGLLGKTKQAPPLRDGNGNDTGKEHSIECCCPLPGWPQQGQCSACGIVIACAQPCTAPRFLSLLQLSPLSSSISAINCLQKLIQKWDTESSRMNSDCAQRVLPSDAVEREALRHTMASSTDSQFSQTGETGGQRQQMRIRLGTASCTNRGFEAGHDSTRSDRKRCECGSNRTCVLR
jgi:hypothetical protein